MGSKGRSPILLSQYWRIKPFYREPKNNNHFGCTNNIFVYNVPALLPVIDHQSQAFQGPLGNMEYLLSLFRSLSTLPLFLFLCMYSSKAIWNITCLCSLFKKLSLAFFHFTESVLRQLFRGVVPKKEAVILSIDMKGLNVLFRRFFFYLRRVDL